MCHCAGWWITIWPTHQTFLPSSCHTCYYRFLPFWIPAVDFHGIACCYAQFEVPFFNWAFFHRH